MNVSSAALPDELAPGATPDLDTLFNAHYARLTRVIGRVIQDQARAEELAVEVFVKLQRNGLPAHAEAWLYRTATREALDEYRRGARRRKFEHWLAPFRVAPLTPEQLHEADVGAQQVRAVLANMRPRDAQLLLLWSEELSYRELAQALEIQETYLGSLLSRAKQTFRKEYEKRYGKQS